MTVPMLELPIRRLHQPAPVQQRDEVSSVAPLSRDAFDHPVGGRFELDRGAQFLVRDDPDPVSGALLEPDDASWDVPARTVEGVGSPREERTVVIILDQQIDVD